MKKKNKSSPVNPDERSSKKHQNDNPAKRNPTPDERNEETEPPIRETPIADNPHHPHHEEIMDGIPK